MLQYDLANIQPGKDGTPTVTRTGSVTPEKRHEIHQWFNFLYCYHVCRSAEQMVIESGNDLASYLDDISQLNGSAMKNFDGILITANKLLISYLSFLRTYIDVVSNALSRRGKEKSDKFKETTHIVYDTLPGYRFLYKMRNYVVHYDIPLTSITCSSREGVHVHCVKKTLLEYNGWGTVKAEIEQMPDEIDILPFVGECQAAVNQLYLVALDAMAADAIEAEKNLKQLCREYRVETPILVAFDEEEKLQLDALPLEQLREFFTDLSQHPDYDITIEDPL